jgi:lauroyl/myristoyl acyltransferase
MRNREGREKLRDASPAVARSGVDKLPPPPEAPPRFIAGDFKFLALASVLGPASVIAPPASWPAFCQFLAQLPGQSRRNVRQIAEGMAIAMPQLEFSQRLCLARNLKAERNHAVMQCLRGLLGRPPVDIIEVIGADHLEAALAGGHGAVLWVGHFAFASSIAKMALAHCGHPPWQVTAVQHGVSNSRFGMRWLNRSVTTLEDQYLSGRLVHDPANPAALPRAVIRKLSQGNVVTINAGGEVGTTVFRTPFMGAHIAFRFGAPRLATLARAPLLPVFAVRVGRPATFRVTIEPPLNDDLDSTRVAREFIARLEPYVRSYPEQWLGWNALTASCALQQARGIHRAPRQCWLCELPCSLSQHYSPARESLPDR